MPRTSQGAAEPGRRRGRQCRDANRRGSRQLRSAHSRQRKHLPPRPAPPAACPSRSLPREPGPPLPRPQCACVGRLSSRFPKPGWGGVAAALETGEGSDPEGPLGRLVLAQREGRGDSVQDCGFWVAGASPLTVAAGTVAWQSYSDTVWRSRLFARRHSHCSQGQCIFDRPLEKRVKL